MKTTKEQRQYIYKLAAFNKETKEEWVQWACNDNAKTSTNDLNFDQANAIISQAGGTPHVAGKLKNECWGFFDSVNAKHILVLSLCRQLNWVITSEKHGKIADLNRLSNFLKSKKSPVRKPLKKMSAAEVSKIISALEGIIKSSYGK